MITRPIARDLALPPYSREALTSDTVIYHSLYGAKFYDYLSALLTIAFGKEILPTIASLEQEHKQFDAEDPHMWSDWFSFRLGGSSFHIHLAWGDQNGQGEQFGCSLTGSIHHRAMDRLANFLHKKDFPFQCYRIPFTWQELSACVSVPSYITA